MHKSNVYFKAIQLCCQGVLYSSYVQRPKTILASLAIWDQMSKDVTDPLRADEKFVIPNISLFYRQFVPTHPSHSWFWSGSDRNDAKSALRHIFCLEFCLDFLWRLVNFIEVIGSSSCIFHVNMPDQEKIHWIHGGADPRLPLCLSARMRQQSEDVDHLHCSPTKTSR